MAPRAFQLHEPMTHYNLFPSPDIEKIIKEINAIGATSFKLLTPENRSYLAQEARKADYVRQPEYLPNVREQVSSCFVSSLNSPFIVFQKELEHLLNSELEKLDPPPFDLPIKFSEVSLQKYEKGSIGITPHHDFKKYRNLIAILVLEGKGRFCICDDREKSNYKEIDAKAGNIILMRGVGFMQSDFRPFHFIDRITEDRYVLGLRQTAN